MAAFALSKSDGDGGIICGCAQTCPDAATLDLIFIGVVPAAGVCSISGLRFTAYDLTAVTVTGGPGDWTALEVGSWSADVYGDGCENPPTGTTDGTFDVDVNCADGVFNVLATITGTGNQYFRGSGFNPVSNATTQGYFEGGICTISW